VKCIRGVPRASRSRRAAQQATACSNRAPAWLDGVVRVARGAGEERLNHQVVSFKCPPIPSECPECCGNPQLLCRGTRSSNPSPSSRQSVSRGISPSCIEKSAVAAACAAPARRHGRQRRAGLVNITPIAGNVSAGRYSSTAVPARRFATLVALVRTARSG